MNKKEEVTDSGYKRRLEVEAEKLERYFWTHRMEPMVQAHLLIIAEWAKNEPKLKDRELKLRRMVQLAQMDLIGK